MRRYGVNEKVEDVVEMVVEEEMVVPDVMVNKTNTYFKLCYCKQYVFFNKEMAQ